MNRQEMIETLKQYKGLHAECRRLRERIDETRAGMYDIQAVAMRGANVRSGDIADRVERAVEMLNSAVDYYVRKLIETEEAERRITELIDSLSNSEERDVLFMHYIEFKSFSEIGRIIYLSERTVWCRHNAAISALCGAAEK